jgi:hypothetical protein
MNKYQSIVELLYENAEDLEKEASIREADKKYSEDLGLWAIKRNKLEKLKKDLEGLAVEIGHYHDAEDKEKIPVAIDNEEFPTLPKDLIELEVRTDRKDKNKILKILKEIDAIELEKYHIANLKERVRRVNSALSSFVKNNKDKSLTIEDIKKVLQHIGAENVKLVDKNKTKYKFTLNDVPMIGND